MIFNNTYISKHKNINDVINHIDNFEEIINKFRLKYPDYEYTINFNKEKQKWNVEIIITNEKQENVSTFTKAPRACTVL